MSWTRRLPLCLLELVKLIKKILAFIKASIIHVLQGAENIMYTPHAPGLIGTI